MLSAHQGPPESIPHSSVPSSSSPPPQHYSSPSGWAHDEPRDEIFSPRSPPRIMLHPMYFTLISDSIAPAPAPAQKSASLSYPYTEQAPTRPVSTYMLDEVSQHWSHCWPHMQINPGCRPSGPCAILMSKAPSPRSSRRCRVFYIRPSNLPSWASTARSLKSRPAPARMSPRLGFPNHHLSPGSTINCIPPCDSDLKLLTVESLCWASNLRITKGPRRSRADVFCV